MILIYVLRKTIANIVVKDARCFYYLFIVTIWSRNVEFFPYLNHSLRVIFKLRRETRWTLRYSTIDPLGRPTEQYKRPVKILITRQVSTMIHSARPTVSGVANIVFTWNLFCLEKWGRTDLQTDDMCENNDHYRPWVRVGLVDQLLAVLWFSPRGSLLTHVL